MTSQEPLWRVRARPCPFYSQGRCLFADACNFLHDIKVKSHIDDTIANPKLIPSRNPSPAKPPINLPSVVIDSPHSDTLSISSPCRSPRLSGLLLALQDVIGPEDESVSSEDMPNHVGEEDTTDVNSGLLRFDHEAASSPVSDPHNLPFVDVDSASETNSLFSESSFLEPDSGHVTDEEDSGVIDLSCISGGDETYESELDDEDEQPTLRPVNSPPETNYFVSVNPALEEQSAEPSSDVHVSDLSAVSDDQNLRLSNLLSPVEMSTRLRPFSIQEFDLPLKREDSIDSGYADSWTGPIPLMRSPPHVHSNRSSVNSDFRHRLAFPPSRRTSYDVRVFRPPHNRSSSSAASYTRGASPTPTHLESGEAEFEEAPSEEDSFSCSPRRTAEASSSDLEETGSFLIDEWDNILAGEEIALGESANSPARSLSYYSGHGEDSTKIHPLSQPSTLKREILNFNRDETAPLTRDSVSSCPVTASQERTNLTAEDECDNLLANEDMALGKGVNSPARFLSSYSGHDVVNTEIHLPRQPSLLRRESLNLTHDETALLTQDSVGLYPVTAPQERIDLTAEDECDNLPADEDIALGENANSPACFLSNYSEHDEDNTEIHPLHQPSALRRESLNLTHDGIAPLIQDSVSSYPVTASQERADLTAEDKWDNLLVDEDIALEESVNSPARSLSYYIKHDEDNTEIHPLCQPSTLRESLNSTHDEITPLTEKSASSYHVTASQECTDPAIEDRIENPKISEDIAATISTVSLCKDDETLSSASSSPGFKQQGLTADTGFFCDEGDSTESLDYHSSLFDDVRVSPEQFSSSSLKEHESKQEELDAGWLDTEPGAQAELFENADSSSSPPSPSGSEYQLSEILQSMDLPYNSVDDLSGDYSPVADHTIMPLAVTRRDRAGSDLTVGGKASPFLTVKAISKEITMSPTAEVLQESSPFSTPPILAEDLPSHVPCNVLSQKDTLQSLYDSYMETPSDQDSLRDEEVLVSSTSQAVISRASGSTKLETSMLPDHTDDHVDGSPGTMELLPRENALEPTREDLSGAMKSVEAFPTSSSSSSPDMSCNQRESPQTDDSIFCSSPLPGPPRVFSPPTRVATRGRVTSDATSSVSSTSQSTQKLGSPFQAQSQVDVSHVYEDPTPRPAARFRNPTGGDRGDSRKIPFGFRRPSTLVSTRSSPIIPSTSHQLILSNVHHFPQRPEIRTNLPVLQSHSPSWSVSDTPSTDHLLSPVQPQSDNSTNRLKPLQLSTSFNFRSTSSSPLFSSSSSNISDHISRSSTPHSSSVSSDYSFSHNSLLSSARSSLIPQHVRNTLIPANKLSPLLLASDHTRSSHLFNRDSQPFSAPLAQQNSWRFSHYRAGSCNFTPADQYYRPSSRLSTLTLDIFENREEEDHDQSDRWRSSTSSNQAPDARPASVMASPVHAIATPKPTLMFAIASDDVDQVRRVLESGDAGPNDQVGPQSALAFTLTNDQIINKVDIVKALLSYGADPGALKNPDLNPPQHGTEAAALNTPHATTLDGMDPATRYYISRADAVHTRQTSQLIHRSVFRPLTKVRYDLVGQDRALEQLFRVLNMHSQRLSVAPIVVLLCGPSGHGKSLLARKFGSLLDLPTHTVNMTTLRSTHDIWQSYSMSPYEEPSSSTLAQFLLDHEGQRCVVVLDEIEKTEDEKALWSLLMPWELGRCSVEAGKRHVDVRNVVWLGTSNIGHDLVFEYQESREDPDASVSREEYVELMALMRPRVSQRLGASLLSRVTTVLPFVPFSLEEKRAIAAEAIYSLAGDMVRTMSPQQIESMVMKALPNYLAAEGARSLYRAISSQLVEM